MIGTLNKAIILFVFSLSSYQATSNTIEPETVVITESQRANTAYTMWDNILQTHVSKSGVVNYKGIKAHADFSKVVSKFEETDISALSKKDAKIFWMNAYNVFTIKLIVDNYPVKSITDLSGGKPWDKKFITINSKSYTLNDIEQNILRKNYNDPRIHFAINCASYSCPIMYNRAFFAESADKILTTLTKNFVNDSKRNTIAADKIKISKIFEWYNGDFTKNGSLISFLNKYSKVKINDSAKVEYMTYNWNLNNK